MSHNTFGHLFRVTTWGESHGPALGCVVDGCPPGLQLSEADVQPWLDRRRPGQGKFVTQRQEPDTVRILSGVFQDERTAGQVTTGTPISMMIDNVDQRSRDYSEIAQAFRPGHADYAYFAKYGVRDYRGGGRQSARETAARVAAGAVARKIVEGVVIRGAVVQIGPHAVDPARIDFGVTGDNLFWAPDPDIVPVWEEHLEKVRKAGSSTGAVVAVEATGVPAGWGAPLYGKLDAELAAALMSINAAKGVEIGAGFASAALSGRKTQTRCGWAPTGRSSCPTGRAACWAASPRVSPSRPASPSSPPPPSSRCGVASTRRARRSSCAPRAGTTPASASARFRWWRRWSPASWPTPSFGIAPRPAATPSAPDHPSVEPAPPDHLSGRTSD